MKDRKFKGVNTRECFRIEYPLSESLFFVSEGRRYPVVNISEKGGKFGRIESTGELKGVKMRGAIALACGESVDVEGEVIREYEDGFVIFFSSGVPLALIVKEQRYLLAKYRHVS